MTAGLGIALLAQQEFDTLNQSIHLQLFLTLESYFRYRRIDPE